MTSRLLKRLSYIALLVALFAPEAGGAAAPRATGRIAFVAVRELRPAQLVTVDAQGADRRRVAFGDDSDLVVARDGGFAFDQAGATDKLYVSDIRGTRRIGEGQPLAFSPDGAALVVYDQNGDRYELLDRLTGSVRLSVPSKQPKGEYYFLGWAGDSLLFTVTTGDGTDELDAIRRDGTGDQVIAKDVGAAAVSPDGTWIAYTSAGQLHIVRPDGTNDRVLAEVGELLAWSPDGSQIAVITSPGDSVAFVALDGTIRQSKLTDSDYESDGDWSSDGRSFAVSDTDGALTVIDTATGNARRVAAAGAFYPSWSPDGRTLLVAPDDTSGRGVVVPAAGGALHQLDPATGDAVWLPDGRLLLALDADRVQQLATIAPPGGRVRFIPGTEGGSSPAWSPVGARLAFAFVSPRTSNTVIAVCDADGKHRRQLTRSDRRSASPSWSPDGRFIAFAGRAGIYIVASTGGVPRLVTGASDPFTVDWSPDGTQLAFGDDSGGITVVGVGGKHKHHVVIGPVYVSNSGIAWSPDGKELAFDKQVGDVDELVTVWVRSHHQSELAKKIVDPSWSPAGDRIAGTLDAHTIAVIDVRRPANAHVLALGTDPAWQPRSR